jgi:hypothetical protein
MWIELDRGWSALEQRLTELAESGVPGDILHRRDDQALESLGFLDLGEVSELGKSYHLTKVVLKDDDAARAIVASILQSIDEVNTFCRALWGRGKVDKTGALSLLKTLSRGVADDEQAKRYLEMMNRGRLINYNRNSLSIEVLYNPGGLAAPDDAAQRERHTGHIIAEETPFGNLLAVKQLLRSASKSLRWYEQHMEGKVLEVLYSELSAGQVTEVRLLSGPSHITETTKSEFKRFQKELGSTRKIQAEWRILDKARAQKIHGRFFISDGISRLLPPLNLILQGARDEIVPTDTEASEFDEWWAEGSPIETFTLPGS